MTSDFADVKKRLQKEIKGDLISCRLFGEAPDDLTDLAGLAFARMGVKDGENIAVCKLHR